MKAENPGSLTAERRRWRVQAAAIIEELFAGAPPAFWDALLDLRGAMLRGDDWEFALDLFLHCKARLEADNYLPFYRLRRLLAASLRFESTGLGEDTLSLAKVLRQPHRSLAEARAALLRASGSLHYPGFGGSRRLALPLQLREV